MTSWWEMTPEQIKQHFGKGVEPLVIVNPPIPRFKGAQMVGYVGDGKTDPVPEPVLDAPAEPEAEPVEEFKAAEPAGRSRRRRAPASD
jgi:hypothetical protein